MKQTILCLIGAATLFLTNGCIVRTYDHGAYYGPTEYERGEYHYRTYPARDRYGYWDRYGCYHRYGRTESRGQFYWESRY